MISETAFAQGFSSFWKSATPNSERVVRKLNLAVERIDLPVGYGSLPERRAFINESGFVFFRKIFDGTQLRMPSKIKGLKDEVFTEVRQALTKYEDINPENLVDANKDEWNEIYLLADTIEKFVSNLKLKEDRVAVSPFFSGCGLLSGCYGDLLIGTTLIEIKGGDRSFRATDIRQLLTYCALNSLSKQYTIDAVGCLNPRKGIYFIIDLETLSLEVTPLIPEPALYLLQTNN